MILTKEKEVKEVIEDPINKAIINHLYYRNRLNPGDIIRNLKIPTQEGMDRIITLKNLGFINHIEKTSLIEVNKDRVSKSNISLD